MSLKDFFAQVMENHRDDLEQIAELERILDQLLPTEQIQISIVSVTNNW